MQKSLKQHRKEVLVSVEHKIDEYNRLLKREVIPHDNGMFDENHLRVLDALQQWRNKLTDSLS